MIVNQAPNLKMLGLLQVVLVGRDFFFFLGYENLLIDL